jgi:hypothetical protein
MRQSIVRLRKYSLLQIFSRNQTLDDAQFLPLEILDAKTFRLRCFYRFA